MKPGSSSLAGPQAMQRLLHTANWETDAVRDYGAEQLGCAIEIDMPGAHPERTSRD
ncbi:hypothetical protein [Nonomuraea jabiensis]|uniref:hypothetical protein n=1 Tax=Nonomuraea jabiensis TaxID=882448 RepID=UPI003675EBA9